jgi:acetylglutamate kinase
MSLQQEALAKAEVLSQALPWLLKFRGTKVVIKFGGNAMVDPELFQAFAQDVVFLKLAGIDPIIVHGGGPQISLALKNADIESRFIKGLRYTEEKAINIIKDVLVNVIQKEIVQTINGIYQCAEGFSGDENGLIKARRTTSIDGEEIDLGLVGEVEDVDSKTILQSIAQGKVPVVSTLALSDKGELLNINADYAAAAISQELKAEKLVMLTDVIGLMRNFPDPESLISSIDIARLESLLPSLDQGMRPKMQACLWSVAGGVGRAHVIDGRIPHGLMVEVFTDQGAGTMVVKNG